MGMYLMRLQRIHERNFNLRGGIVWNLFETER